MKTSMQEEDDADAHRQRHVDLREHVGEAGEHDDEEAGDDAARQEPGKLEGENERDEIDREGKNPEQRDRGDVCGEITGDGAQLHGRAHGQQHPKQLVRERRGRSCDSSIMCWLAMAAPALRARFPRQGLRRQARRRQSRSTRPDVAPSA